MSTKNVKTKRDTLLKLYDYIYIYIKKLNHWMKFKIDFE